MEMTVASSARSDVGRVRAVNEDSYIARMPLFLVADGMGGHARGEAASAEAIRVFADRFAEGDVPTPDEVLDTLRHANAAVRSISAEGESGVAVAGTTLAGIVLVRTGDGAERHFMVLNVGDSRVYDWDDGTLQQVSVDHSAVQELLDAGVISDDEAAAHPDRNIITRALGAGDDVEADVWLLPAAGRGGYLICSDGLSKELDDLAIATVLDRDAADPADALVAAALDAGGRDNVTVVVVSVDMPDDDRDDTTADRTGDRRLLEDTGPRG